MKPQYIKYFESCNALRCKKGLTDVSSNRVTYIMTRINKFLSIYRYISTTNKTFDYAR